jgi:hypothetical protein
MLAQLFASWTSSFDIARNATIDQTAGDGNWQLVGTGVSCSITTPGTVYSPYCAALWVRAGNSDNVVNTRSDLHRSSLVCTTPLRSIAANRP